MRRVPHLIGRFATSLWPRRVRREDVAWVRSVLERDEWQVWQRLGRADRMESVRTARRLGTLLGGTRHVGDPRYVAAALLHDAGKAEVGLGTLGRVGATVAGLVRPAGRVGGRWGRYLRHAEEGARLLGAAGARPEAVAWAAAHHDPVRWPAGSIPLEVCEALAAADGERSPRSRKKAPTP